MISMGSSAVFQKDIFLPLAIVMQCTIKLLKPFKVISGTDVFLHDKNLTIARP